MGYFPTNLSWSRLAPKCKRQRGEAILVGVGHSGSVSLEFVIELTKQLKTHLPTSAVLHLALASFRLAARSFYRHLSLRRMRRQSRVP